MDNGNDRGGPHGSSAANAKPARAWARDVVGAIALAEGAASELVLVDDAAHALALPATNAFGDAVSLERVGSTADASALVRRAGQACAEGRRVAIVAAATGLASARAAMRELAHARLGVVAHALCPFDGSASGDAVALAQLGWGVLFASSVGESLDLALVARRAAEDSGTPFVIVHERSHVRHVEPMTPISTELCDVFVGAPRSRLARRDDGTVARDDERAFAERVPFALASAMRELESLTGRAHDAFERLPPTDAHVALVGLGTVGDSLLAEAPRLREAGHDVVALKLVALRPFPGARLVKALSRALAITVVEHADVPLAQSNPLTAEIKAAFADAITWAPDYPGIGRVPRILSAIAGAHGHELESRDLDALVHNMLADERGKRTFVLGSSDLAPASHEHERVHAAAGDAADVRASSFSVRGICVDALSATACANLCVAVVASALGLRARAAIRPLRDDEGAGFAFDLVAGRDKPRGGHAPHAARLVALSDLRVLASTTPANPLRRLARGGVVAIPSAHRAADAVWSEVPAWVKALVHERDARLVGYDARASSIADPWRIAAAYAGLTLAVASSASRGSTNEARPAHVDPSLVAREVASALEIALEGSGGDASANDRAATEGGELARRAFEAHVEVPRATVERDEEGLRLGRRDARASSSPR